ncbi:MAG: hypothetical protein HYY32_02105 [Chloroflexi bacterium]|nr:hypothetical protein [Chloroflexota bacterium]
MVMVFLSDQLMGRVLIKRLKKLTFFSRTAVFVAYSLLALPAMTIAGAALLRYTVLEAFQEWMLPALALAFLLTGVLLSSRYNMRLK